MRTARLSLTILTALILSYLAIGCSSIQRQSESANSPARPEATRQQVGQATSTANQIGQTPAATPQPNTRPTQVNDAAHAPSMRVQQGFRAFVFQEGLNRPTSLAFGPDGRLYVGQQNGSIISLASQNGKGTSTRQVASVGGTLLGIAFRPGTRDLYISTSGRVMISRGAADGSFGSPTQLVGGLPTGRHQNDQIAFALDGNTFFIGIGSTCDACVERDPRSASVMRMSSDGRQTQVYAKGLRNPFGVAVHPQTGEVFATDNGRDAPLTGVPDELNLLVENGHYGFPDCWGRGQGSRCQDTLPPVAEFQEHSSANGFTFYTGSSFPAEYGGNAFVALWGGNVPVPTVGKRVERVKLEKVNGRWQGNVTTFASGFDHPITVAVGPSDGALYVADHGSGVIYRIVWEGS